MGVARSGAATNSAASRFVATFANKPDAMVYGAGSALRSDISGPGVWAFLPAKLPASETIVVNAGFVPNTMQDRAQQDRAAKPLMTGVPLEMTGYLRFPEAPGKLMPDPDRTKRLWFARDIPAMADALLGGAIAPFYIDLEISSAGKRRTEAWPARRPSQRRSPAIRDHLVRAGGRRHHRLRRLVARPAASLNLESVLPGLAQEPGIAPVFRLPNCIRTKVH